MNDKYLYLTSKHLTGEIAEAEREELFAWVNESEVNKAAFEEMQELWILSADVEEEFDTDVAVAWGKVAKRTITKEAKIIRYPWSKQLLRIAAVIFVVVGGYWMMDSWNQKPEDIVAFVEFDTFHLLLNRQCETIALQHLKTRHAPLLHDPGEP